MKRKANLWPPDTLNLNAEWTLTSAMLEGKPAAEPSKVQAIDGKHGICKPAAEPSKVQAIDAKQAISTSVATDVFPVLNLMPWPTPMFPELNHARLIIDLD